MVPGLGKVQAGLFGGMEELLLSTNKVVPDGAKIMAAGRAPAGKLLPLVLKMPVVKSMLKDETEESPWVATKTAPVPEPVELLLEQAVKLSNKTGTTTHARNRNLVPILFFSP
jgi:hypothetical protein